MLPNLLQHIRTHASDDKVESYFYLHGSCGVMQGKILTVKSTCYKGAELKLNEHESLELSEATLNPELNHEMAVISFVMNDQNKRTGSLSTEEYARASTPLNERNVMHWLNQVGLLINRDTVEWLSSLNANAPCPELIETPIGMAYSRQRQLIRTGLLAYKYI